MTEERYKQLMEEVGLPNSRSLLLALQQAVTETTINERHACANVLEAEADRMELIWNKYIADGGKGPATSFHTIPRAYAEMIRNRF